MPIGMFCLQYCGERSRQGRPSMRWRRCHLAIPVVCAECFQNQICIGLAASLPAALLAFGRGTRRNHCWWCGNGDDRQFGNGCHGNPSVLGANHAIGREINLHVGGPSIRYRRRVCLADRGSLHALQVYGATFHLAPEVFEERLASRDNPILSVSDFLLTWCTPQRLYRFIGLVGCIQQRLIAPFQECLAQRQAFARIDIIHAACLRRGEHAALSSVEPSLRVAPLGCPERVAGIAAEHGEGGLSQRRWGSKRIAFHGRNDIGGGRRAQVHLDADGTWRGA